MQTIRITTLLLLLLALPLAAQQYANGGMFSSVSIAGLFPDELPGERSGGASEDAAKSAARTMTLPAPAPAPAPAAIMFRPVDQPMPLAAAIPSNIRATEQKADLRMFSGARIGSVIQLHWETVTNAGTKAFAIERRSQLHQHWQSVGYVRSAHAAGRDFQFLDNLRGDGVAYYRLRQLRVDGSTVVSPVISVTPDAVPQTFSLWTKTTEPFQNYGTVSFGLDHRSEVKLTLHDRFGNLIATLLDYQVMDEGHHVLPIATSRLESGLYFLRLHSASGSRKLLLLHI